MTWETAASTAEPAWATGAVTEPKTEDSWNAAETKATDDAWSGGNFKTDEPADTFDKGFSSGDARNDSGNNGDSGYTNASHGEEEDWGRERPPPRDLSDMKCYNCQGMGHGSRFCPEPPREREVRPLLDWSHVPEMPSEDAWTLLKQADAIRDLDDIKDAFEAYAKNTLEATFQTIEERLRAEEMNLRLVCLEKEIPMNKTNVNLQMEADKKYVVGYQLSVKSRRTKMNEGMLAESYEENFERLADCGFTVASSVPVCYNCNQKGHVGKDCPEDRPDPLDRDMSHVVKVVCTNCEQEGHRLRSCPEPRRSKRACNNCGSQDHMIAECDQPRRPREGDSCFNCGSPDHYGRDCTEERKPRPDDRECYNCQQSGHIGKDCPEPRKPRGRRDNDFEHESKPSAEDDYPAVSDEAPAWNANEQPSWQTNAAPEVTAGGW